MPELDAMEFLSTRNESNTPSSSGSIGSPVLQVQANHVALSMLILHRGNCMLC